MCDNRGSTLRLVILSWLYSFPLEINENLKPKVKQQVIPDLPNYDLFTPHIKSKPIVKLSVIQVNIRKLFYSK